MYQLPSAKKVDCIEQRSGKSALIFFFRLIMPAHPQDSERIRIECRCNDNGQECVQGGYNIEPQQDAKKRKELVESTGKPDPHSIVSMPFDEYRLSVSSNGGGNKSG